MRAAWYAICVMITLFSVPISRAQGNLGSNSSPVVNRQGIPLGGASIAVCQPLATTGASVSNGLATLVMSSNPVTAGYVANMSIMVAGFTGADTYLNAGTLTNGKIVSGWTILSVSSTSIVFAISHANASVSTNGTVLQEGNGITSCAGLSQVYQDPALSIPNANPFTSDQLGNWNVFAVSGFYDVQFYTPTTVPTLKVIGVGLVSVGGTVGLSGNNALTGTNTISNLNGVVNLDGVKYTTLATCYAAIPAGGGACVVPPNYSETMAASLTMNKANAGFIFMGPATITMGSNQIIVTPGTSGVFVAGQIHEGGGAVNSGTRFVYTGAGNAVLVGGASVDTRDFLWRNIDVTVSSFGASVVGMYLLRVQNFTIENPGFSGPGAAGAATAMVLDGTNLFTGWGTIDKPMIAFFSNGILGTGSGGANGANAVRIANGLISCISAPGTTVGLDIEDGANDTVTGMDFSSCTVGIKFGANAIGNQISHSRNEGITTDVLALAGSQYNKVELLGNGGPPSLLIVSDAGTNNHFNRSVDGDVETLTVSSFITMLAGGLPATSGTIRLTTDIPIAWRNVANTDNNYLRSIGVANGNVPVNTLAYLVQSSGLPLPIWGNPIIASTGNAPALTGSVRLGNADKITWRDAASGSDHAVGEIQKVRFAGNLGGTCPTAAAIGAPCTSGNINWITAFADNNYTVTCSLVGVMTGQPHVVSVSYQAAGAGITVTIAADTAAAANVAPTGFTDCIAVHD